LKKLALIVIVLAFVARPAYFLGYLAYYELNIDYIVETYCINKDKPVLQCNGKCHLASQLNFATPKTETDAAILVINEAFFPVYFQKTNNHLEFLNTDCDISRINYFYLNNYTFQYSTKLIKPPLV